VTETVHEFVFNPIHTTGPANLRPVGSDNQNNYWWCTDFRRYSLCLPFYLHFAFYLFLLLFYFLEHRSYMNTVQH